MDIDMDCVRAAVICAARAFNGQLDAIAADDEQALDAHAQCISRYCDALPKEVRELFRDHCIMPEV